MYADGIPPDGTPVVVVHSLSVEITILHFLLAGIILTSVLVGFWFGISNYISKEKVI